MYLQMKDLSIFEFVPSLVGGAWVLLLQKWNPDNSSTPIELAKQQQEKRYYCLLKENWKNYFKGTVEETT